MRKKKIICVLIIAVLCSQFLACHTSEKEDNQLTIYLDSYSSSFLKPAIESFEREETGTQINVVDLSDMTIAESSKKLLTDTMGGKGPDVICFHSLLQRELDVYKLMSSGAFMDLSNYIENGDSDLSYDNSVQGVMDAGVYNGKRYLLPASYIIPLMMTSRNNLEETAITLDENSSINQVTDQYGQYVARCEQSGIKPKAIFGQPDAFLNVYTLINIKLFDYENKTVNLNTENFRSATEFNRYMELYKRDTNSRKDSMTYRYATEKDQEKVFEGFMFPLERQLIAASAAIIAGYSEPVLIPVSNSEGGILAQPVLAFGIKNGCKNPEAAYKFISYFFQRNFQLALTDGIPIIKGGLEQGFNVFTNPVYRLQAEQSLFIVSPDGNEVDLKPKIDLVSDEFMEKMRTIEDRITGAFNTPFYARIADSMSAYTTEGKSYEKAVQKTAEMAQIYISE